MTRREAEVTAQVSQIIISVFNLKTSYLLQDFYKTFTRPRKGWRTGWKSHSTLETSVDFVCTTGRRLRSALLKPVFFSTVEKLYIRSQMFNSSFNLLLPALSKIDLTRLMCVCRVDLSTRGATPNYPVKTTSATSQ